MDLPGVGVKSLVGGLAFSLLLLHVLWHNQCFFFSCTFFYFYFYCMSDNRSASSGWGGRTINFYEGFTKMIPNDSKMSNV